MTGTGEHGRVRPSRTRFPTHVLRPSAATGHAHEQPPRRSKPLCDTWEPTPDAPSGRSSWARPVGNVARDHVTPDLASPEGEGFPPSPRGTLNHYRLSRNYWSVPPQSASRC